VILNCWHWPQTWRLAKSTYMPILGTVTTHTCQQVKILVFFGLYTLIIKIENRALLGRVKQLMPAENPPKTFVTPDNVEWTFLQTFSNYDKFQKLRLKNMCRSRSLNKKMWRFRSTCQRRYSTYNCQFMLLTMKNTKQRYHVYKHGEHNHPLNTPKGM
jgi:hypothetical protein